jgi:PqqD family protein of HPr-rel-A system
MAARQGLAVPAQQLHRQGFLTTPALRPTSLSDLLQDPAAAPPAWRGISSDQLLVHEWDNEDGCVAYAQHSGQTHLLSTLAAELLVLLWQSPLSSAELARRVQPAMEDQPDAEHLAELVEATLQQLQAAGLAEPVAS